MVKISFPRKRRSDLVRSLREILIFGIGMVIFFCLFGYWLEVSPTNSQESWNKTMLHAQQESYIRQGNLRRMQEEHGDAYLMRLTNQ